MLSTDQERLTTLRVAVAIEQAQHDRGEWISYTSELMASIKQNAQLKLRAGWTPKTDVRP